LLLVAAFFFFAGGGSGTAVHLWERRTEEEVLVAWRAEWRVLEMLKDDIRQKIFLTLFCYWMQSPKSSKNQEKGNAWVSMYKFLPAG
jgi:hypothetical protein